MRLSVSVERIERKIYVIRDQKVMLDSDLAELYEVQTKILNKAVKRNLDRFPEDFMFRVAPEEIESLRFQIGTSNTSQGGRRYMPYVFSEHGVAMLSSVLNSKRAVQMNIAIIRAFIKLREVLATHKDLAHKIDDLEFKYQEHDHELKVVFDAIRKLISTPAPTKRRMGFAVGNS
jgi:phage regulator Rha-like protein